MGRKPGPRGLKELEIDGDVYLGKVQIIRGIQFLGETCREGTWVSRDCLRARGIDGQLDSNMWEKKNLWIKKEA